MSAIALWCATLLVPAAHALAPALTVDPCAEPAAGAGERRCVSVRLQSNGHAVATLGARLGYDTRQLRIALLPGPGNRRDVEPGAVLTGGQALSVEVVENLGTSAGRLRVVVIPPIVLTPPALADGEVFRACFTIPADATAGCAPVAFVFETESDADFGNPAGSPIAVDPALLSGGGVEIAEEGSTTTTTTAPVPTTTTTTAPVPTTTTTTAPVPTTTTTAAATTTTTSPCRDGDGDGVCDEADRCPGVPDAAQGDRDGDGAGDVCDPDDAPLRVSGLRVARRPGGGRGGVRVTGDVTLPGGTLLSTAGGLALRVQDATALDVTARWSAAECRPGKKAQVGCSGSEGAITLRPLRGATGRLRVSATLHGVPPARLAAPVTLTLAEGALVGGLDRAGRVASCTATRAGLRCR